MPVDTCIRYSDDDSDKIMNYIKSYMTKSGYEYCEPGDECESIGMFAFLPNLCKIISKKEPDWKIIDRIVKQFPKEKFTILSIDTGCSDVKNTYGWYLECKGDKILKGDKNLLLFSPEQIKYFYFGVV